MEKIRLALLASGGGSTVKAILEAIQARTLHGVEPAVVIASSPTAGVIEKAAACGIPEDDIEIIRRRDHQTDLEFGAKIIGACTARGVNLIGQYGWLPTTPYNVLTYYSRVINQHPGALDPNRATPDEPHPHFGGPGMYGRRVIAAALHFAHETDANWWVEATTHLVIPKIDGGPIVRARRIDINKDDTVESVQQRLLPVEHAVQIATLADIVHAGRIITCSRQEPLIAPKHLPELRRAKELAIQEYPKG